VTVVVIVVVVVIVGPRVQLGSTGIGIQVGEGVVLAVEKRVTSKLLEPSSIEKIVEIDQHMGMPVDHHTLRARALAIMMLAVVVLRHCQSMP